MRAFGFNGAPASAASTRDDRSGTPFARSTDMRMTAASSCLLVCLLGAPQALASPAAATPPAAGEIEWAGDPGSAHPVSGPTLAVVSKDDVVRYVLGGDRRPAHLQRVRFHRDIVWDQPVPAEFVDAAALVVDIGTGAVYLAHYSAIASGATLLAFDLASGAARWTTPVRGLGPVAHSKYSNQVKLQMLRGALVLYGNESAGRYIEVFDPASGRMLSTRTLPAGGAAAATPSPGPEPCRSSSDIERLSGRRAVIIGSTTRLTCACGQRRAPRSTEDTRPCGWSMAPRCCWSRAGRARRSGLSRSATSSSAKRSRSAAPCTAARCPRPSTLRSSSIHA